MTTARILLVDDEPDLLELLTLTLLRMGLETATAETVAEAQASLRGESFDLCLSDMRLPDGDGLQLLAWIQEHCPGLPVAILTAHGNVETAVQALKRGAFDFVSKPVDLGVLRRLVARALRLAEQRADSTATRAVRLLGTSTAMQKLREMSAKVARSQAPVHITGGSGTGKELVARLIHHSGPRTDGSFVPVNCGAIPAELMESEFFGYRRGSFTGAVADKKGLVQAAEGGTLFLDEVAELPLHMQVKLLRVIQEKSVRPIGESQEQPVDVRILSATHRNLAELVAAGRFREDLYYRINVIELRVPPLRERREDIPELALLTLERLARRAGTPSPVLAPEALEQLMAYDFPGNVRELENILERALALSSGEQIEAEDLQLRQAARGTGGAVPVELEQHIEHVERQAIQKALEQTRFNKTAAARLLGISFRALRYRMEKLGLE
jgi:two-component system response regulator PilR (NtrC family)